MTNGARSLAAAGKTMAAVCHDAMRVWAAARPCGHARIGTGMGEDVGQGTGLGVAAWPPGLLSALSFFLISFSVFEFA